jgi:hypothetical protein
MPQEMYGNVSISAEEFDELMGHWGSVTDTIESCFAVELIAAYLEAKVVYMSGEISMIGIAVL